MSKPEEKPVATEREQAVAELMLATHLRDSMECMKGRKYALAITVLSHEVMVKALSAYMGRLMDELGIPVEEAK